jgi:DNA-binding transcriptional ArsR family regulator
MAQGSKYDDPGAAFISAKMAKALANPWRSRILMELSSRPMSPSQFVEEVGGELTNISRCFRQLAEWDYVEVVETRRGGSRRGGVEHVYRSIQRAYFDTATWESLPRFLRDDFSGNILATYFTRISEALDAGTFDAEIDRHLSWDGVALDRQAWTELSERLDEVLEWLPELEAESTRRMAESGEEPIPTTVGLASFRSPKPSEIKK